MNDAVERSNALYKALEDYWYSDPHLDTETIMEEVANHLSDIKKQQKAFLLDITTLSADLAEFLDEEYMANHIRLFPRPAKCPEDPEIRLKSNATYKQAIDLLKKALLEVARTHD